MMDLIRREIPGEVWRFDALEAHCFRMDFRRVRPFLSEEGAMIVWLQALRVDDESLDFGGSASDAGGFLVTPTEWDRAFLEAFVAQARSHLWLLRPLEGEEEFQLPCGHTAHEHQEALRRWAEREIERPKEFALTRRRAEALPPAERLAGKPLIALEDLERLIEEEVQRLARSLRGGDRAALDDFDKNVKRMAKIAAQHGLTFEEARARYVEAQQKAHDRTLADARVQLREKAREAYRILEPPPR